MAYERPGRATMCVSCRKTGGDKQGANNWKMCDKCLTTYCIECYRKIKNSSSHCTDHQPWGNWLTADGTFATMKFK